MKNLLIRLGFVLVIIIMIIILVNLMELPTPTNAQIPQAKNIDAIYSIITPLVNHTLVEFTPKTDPEIQCVYIYAYSRSGLQCWKKNK